jgi:hypothetical protein
MLCVILLSAIMLSVLMLSVLMLSVVMLNVLAARHWRTKVAFNLVFAISEKMSVWTKKNSFQSLKELLYKKI